MNESQVVDLASQAMLMGLKLAAPILIVSLAVGLLVSLVQTVTQTQDVTLTFVPKLAAIAIVLLVAGHWMISQFVGYAGSLIGHASTLLGG